MDSSNTTRGAQLSINDFGDNTLLIVDDDDPLRGRLLRAMEKKGFNVKEAKTVENAVNIVKKTPPQFAIIDFDNCQLCCRCSNVAKGRGSS